MNEELQKQLAGLIDKASAAGEKAWDFAAKQAPELIQQLLAWKFWEAVMAVVALLIGISIAAWVARRAAKESEKGWDERNDGWIIAGILSAIVGVMMIAGICSLTARAVEIKIAPKVYLIEYISSLRK